MSGPLGGVSHAGVDLLLTPTTPTVAPLLYGPGGVGESAGFADGFDHQSGIDGCTAGYAADCMTVPASLAGLPAISLPVGLGFESGMPVGMQLIAPRGATSSSSARLGTSSGRSPTRRRRRRRRSGGGGRRAAADRMGPRSQGAGDGGRRSVQRDGRLRVGAAVGRVRGAAGRYEVSYEGNFFY